ncbi:MAG: hypothetical protein SFV81_14080 [Pirellulaceae bacterium]|nr:hypothetical protein [Pirellulaceae bacterium]
MSDEKASAPLSETQAIELEMKRLQRDKLRAEVRDASLAWWKRPSYIASAAPIVLAIAGIFTAWFTGFFNREREILKAEIDTLQVAKDKLDQQTTAAKKELEAAVERSRQLQKITDEVYIKVLFHSSGARYAVSMIKPEGQDGWISNADVDAAVKAVSQLPAEDRERAQNIFEQYRIGLEMIDHVHQSMKSTGQLLNALPASERVKRLTLTVAPDHDFVDPATNKTYSIKTIDDFLKQTD